MYQTPGAPAGAQRADAPRSNRFPGWNDGTPTQQLTPPPVQPLVGIVAGQPTLPLPGQLFVGGDSAALAAAAEKRPIVAKRFKTELCRTFEATGTCPYVTRCMFAHGIIELRTPEQNVADGLITEEALRLWRYAQMQRTQQQQQQPAQPSQYHHQAGSSDHRTSDYSTSHDAVPGGTGDPPLMTFIDPDEQATSEARPPTWWRHEPYSVSDDQETTGSGKVACWPASRSDEM